MTISRLDRLSRPTSPLPATVLFNTLMVQLDNAQDRAFARGLEIRPDTILTLKARSW